MTLITFPTLFPSIQRDSYRFDGTIEMVQNTFFYLTYENKEDDEYEIGSFWNRSIPDHSFHFVASKFSDITMYEGQPEARKYIIRSSNLSWRVYIFEKINEDDVLDR